MVKLYGADWCKDTKNTRKYLDSLGIDHQYINIDEDPEACQWVKDQNDGKERKPTLIVNEKILSVPTENELKNALEQAEIIR